MALSRHNDPLMCRLFPSSLGEVAMRWFNQLGRRTINSWDQMAEAFVARFITNSRKRKEMDALLTMKLEGNETIKDYSTRFSETYNDIEGCSEEVAIRTFKLGLPTDTSLRQSLINRPPPELGKIHAQDRLVYSSRGRWSWDPTGSNCCPAQGYHHKTCCSNWEHHQKPVHPNQLCGSYFSGF
jgi:hypothetical protein